MFSFHRIPDEFEKISLGSFQNFLSHVAQRFDMAIDPADVVGHTSIDARETRASAANTETDNALKNVSVVALDDERAARVTLARVLATLLVSGAQHLGLVDLDTLAPVLAIAITIADRGNADLHQDAGSIGSTLAGQSPTSNSGLDVVWDYFSGSRQARGLNGRGKFDGFFQFDDSDIVGGGVWIVLWMVDGTDSAHGLLAAGWSVQVVSSSADCQSRGSVIHAMGSRDDEIGFILGRMNANQGATAKVAALLQTDDPGM